MAKKERGVPVVMVRNSLENVPQAALPEPFTIRRYAEGDEENWTNIHLEADLYSDITPELFGEEFGHDARALAERQFYLCDGEGKAVGTASAWFNADFPEKNWGRIHWVAIVPSAQGKGLAKPLLSACLNRMKELGHNGAYLDTSSIRVPAINLYIRYGFVPHIAKAEDVETWRAIREDVKDEFKAAIDKAIAQWRQPR